MTSRSVVTNQKETLDSVVIRGRKRKKGEEGGVCALIWWGRALLLSGLAKVRGIFRPKVGRKREGGIRRVGGGNSWCEGRKRD